MGGVSTAANFGKETIFCIRQCTHIDRGRTNTFDRLFSHVTKGNNFQDFPFPEKKKKNSSSVPNPFKLYKGSLGFLGTKFFQSQVCSSWQGRQNFTNNTASPLSVSNPLKKSKIDRLSLILNQKYMRCWSVLFIHLSYFV